MPEAVQNYKNHARFFPLFHFFVFPVLLLNVLNTLRHLVTNPNRSNVWETIVALALAGLALAARLMALTVQDRVIRLEMQLRLMRVLPPDLQSRMAGLERQHFVALRFAGDDELPGLVREICDGKLRSTTEIKKRVRHWQPDWLRA